MKYDAILVLYIFTFSHERSTCATNSCVLYIIIIIIIFIMYTPKLIIMIHTLLPLFFPSLRRFRYDPIYHTIYYVGI